MTLEEDRRTGWCKDLVFGKLGGRFRLFIESGVDSHPDGITSTLLVSASRETRLEACDEFATPYEALLDAFEREIERVNKSVGSVERLAKRVRAKGGTELCCDGSL